MQKQQNWEKYERISFRFLQICTQLYFVLLFILLPLYYQKRYVDIGPAKWAVFYRLSWFFTYHNFSFPSFFPIMIIAIIIHHISVFMQKKSLHFNKLDYLIGIYGCFVFLSSIFAVDKMYVMNGYPGWNMGLIAQLSFILIYYIASRFLSNLKIIMPVFYMTAVCVFLLEILNRFYIDPLGMIAPLANSSKDNFVSTIGNINWFCGYLMLVYPIWIYQFYISENKKRWIFGILVMIGSVSFITQGSYGGWLSLAAVLAFLFHDALSSYDTIIHFLETIILMLLSWRGIGFIRMNYPAEIVALDKIFELVMNSDIFLYITGMIIILYVLLRIWKQEINSIHIPYSDIQKAYKRCIACMFFVFIFYFLANNLGLLPKSISSDNRYLKFDDGWATGRGIIWKAGFQTLKKQPFFRLLIGNGPDNCSYALYKYAPKGISAYWGNHIVENAHNEYLTSILNYGIFGATCYMLIYLYSFQILYKSKSKKSYACALAIIAYISSGIISFQTIINGAFIFFIIGIGIKYYK